MSRRLLSSFSRSLPPSSFLQSDSVLPPLRSLPLHFLPQPIYPPRNSVRALSFSPFLLLYPSQSDNAADISPSLAPEKNQESVSAEELKKRSLFAPSRSASEQEKSFLSRNFFFGGQREGRERDAEERALSTENLRLEGVVSYTGESEKETIAPKPVHDDTRVVSETGEERVQLLLDSACNMVKGDISSQLAAQELMSLYRSLPFSLRSSSLERIAVEFGTDSNEIQVAMHEYLDLLSPSLAPAPSAPPSPPPPSPALSVLSKRLKLESRLRDALSPLYLKLFDGLNAGSERGTKFLVDARRDLLKAIKQNKESVPLREMDAELKSLLSSLFSPAHLELRRITWADPAELLEKIVIHEAIHPMKSMLDLKMRVGEGRRFFSFFHSAMPGEPLAFVEVALLTEIPDNAQRVVFGPSLRDEESANTAVFYSITSTQPGLSGIHLGNLLIKKVAMVLHAERPNIENFVTLSPIPGFLNWLLPRLERDAGRDGESKTMEMLEGKEGREEGEKRNEPVKEGLLLEAEKREIVERCAPLLESSDFFPSPPSFPSSPSALLLSLLSHPSPSLIQSNEKLQGTLKRVLMRLCARYILLEKAKGGRAALDPVTNFHVHNGAFVRRFNWMANVSQRGMDSSFGIMVNYQYRLEDIQRNHEAYVSKGRIGMAEDALKLLGGAKEKEA